MRRQLRRVPGLARAYHHARALYSVLYEGWLMNRPRGYDHLLATNVWDFESATNIERYQRTLDMVARHRGTDGWGDALEVGCGIGVFTEMLAPNCRHVMATDISKVGCDRTRERCRQCANVSVELFDLQRDAVRSRHDLVFAMDVLECIHGPARAASIAERLASAVEPGGLLVITMSRLPADMLDSWWAGRLIEGGDAMIQFLDGRHGFRLVENSLYQKYLVAALRLDP